MHSSAQIPSDSASVDGLFVEANRDVDSRRFAQALLKYEWLYEYLSRRARVPRDTIVSPWAVLRAWHKLAEVYAAAGSALVNRRDKAEMETLRASHSRSEIDVCVDAFAEAAVINDILGDDKRTTELFCTIASEDSNLGRNMLYHAKDALIRCGEYDAVSQHINARDAAVLLVEGFAIDGKMDRAHFASDEDFEAFAAVSQRYFSHEAATLVATFAAAQDFDAASDAAEIVKSAWNDSAFRELIDNALSGHFPREIAQSR